VSRITAEKFQEALVAMKLKAHLFPLGDDSSELLVGLIPEDAREIVSARWSVALDDPVLPKILRGGDSTSGFWVSAESILAAAELRELSHFEVICRKFIPESSKDYDLNMAECLRTPLVDYGAESPIRLVDSLYLSRISLKPNMVGGIGDWSGEYVAGSGVAGAFKSGDLSGVTFLPVLNPKTDAPHSEFFQIYSDHVLGPAEIDCSIERVQGDESGEHGGLRHLGCLSYREEILLERPDFLRTAEPWDGWWGWPAWVVSSRVVNTFRERKLRGWAFRPVLVADSQLYSAYLSQWTRLHELVSQCSRSKFDGGRW